MVAAAVGVHQYRWGMTGLTSGLDEALGDGSLADITVTDHCQLDVDQIVEEDEWGAHEVRLFLASMRETVS